jgi:hypothetical protein
VIGGLVASTVAALFILPLAFAWGREKASVESVSLEPEDAASQEYLAAAGAPGWQ